MASSILSIGSSALAAAQVGISTTGHNIANANTEGYSRQKVQQSANQAQKFGYGYVGQGVNVASVTRVYNDLLAKQVINSQSISQGVNTYSTELNTIDNMLSDSTAGLNPALSDFYAKIKNVASNASDIPTRQSLLSSSQALANRFKSMGERLTEIQNDVNTQITGNISSINGLSSQISRLNDIIEKAISVDGNPPNDLMDQRDKLVSDMSQIIKTTIVPQGQGSYNVFVGNGLPVVVGADTFELTPTTSLTDESRIEVGYKSNTKVTILGKDSLVGGKLGGLVEFRSESLDPTQRQLGQIGLVLASEYNEQHRAGVDLNGNTGLDLFSVPGPLVTQNRNNTGNATITSTVTDAKQVTSSDYKLQFDGTNYSVTRINDGNTTAITGFPQTVDGMEFNLTAGAMNAGDQFMIRPTVNVASSFKLNAAVGAEELALGQSTGPTGPSDNRNALALSELELKQVVTNKDGTRQSNFSTAFAQMVSQVGNKANELQVIGASENRVLDIAKAAMQSESGVNLDEEATNLIRYQQAYQAAGKMMQIATDLFNVLLSLGS